MSDREEFDPMEQLLRGAGRRPGVPPERTARVLASVRERWRQTVASRRRRKLMRGALAAAAVVLAVLIVGAWWFRQASPPDEVAARVERGAAADTLRPGDPLRTGTLVATGGAQRLAIRTMSGHSVRLDVDSRVRILSGRALVLEAGALYVDSGGGAAAALEVRTVFGVFRDTGTQFEARIAADALLVRVREGTVAVDGRAGRIDVAAGALLRLDRTGTGTPAPDPTPGSTWTWAEDAAPRLAIEGRTLAAFLDWIARERGLRLVYDGEAATRDAERITLRGSIEELTLDQALWSVLATCGMTARVNDGTLVVFANAEETRPF